MGHLAITPLDFYATIGDDLAAAQRIFDDELAGGLPFVNELCERVRSYRGKMLRPALLLLTGKAVGDLSPSHHTLAAVVEMVHMATLVHDDVLDAADERRRQPTICATEGNVAAVLLGDYLISHAFHLCSSLDSQYASRRIGATTNVVCEGELLQNRHVGDATTDEAVYFDIIGRKTGALTAVACELGAYVAGADDATVAAMRAYGQSAGIAFQIVDDVLDVVGQRTEVGKTLGLDLACGKLTLPTLHCLAHADDATAAALRDVLSGRAVCDRLDLKRWLAETESVEYALDAAGGHVRHAVGQLDRLQESESRRALVCMAEFIIERSF